MTTGSEPGATTGAGDAAGGDAPPPPHGLRHRFVEGQLLSVLLVLLIVVSRSFLPDEVEAFPEWLLPVVAGLLLVVLLVTDWRDHSMRGWSRPISLILVGVLVADNLVTTIEVLDNLLTGTHDDAIRLMETSAQVILTNVVTFALLYWQIDRGGPYHREKHDGRTLDFLFPQMGDSERFPGWHPRLQDYLYTAFTAVTAFGPTDTMPLTHRAKLAMAVQSVVAISIIVVTLSRAIAVLP